MLIGHLFLFPKGSMARPHQDPGGEPWKPQSWVQVGGGWAGWGWGGPVAEGRPPLYFFSFLPDFFLLPLPPAGALPSRLPAALVSVALLPGM